MRTELWKPGIVSVAQDGCRETRETPAIHVTRAGTPFAEKAVCPGAAGPVILLYVHMVLIYHGNLFGVRAPFRVPASI